MLERIIHNYQTLLSSGHFEPKIFISVCLVSLVMNLFLVKLNKIPLIETIKSIFHIKASKSETAAVLLGGLPINILVSSILTFYIYFLAKEHPTQLGDHHIINYALISLGLVLVYGYFDDKFELKPEFKLFLQVITIGQFALLSSKWVYFDHSVLSFLIIFYIGITLFNGVNLLDGLDTISYKLALSTCLLFSLISEVYGKSGLVSELCFGLICSMFGFIIFNKHPSKIHLGEIGPATFAMFFVLISTLVFRDLRPTLGGLNALFLSVLPLSYYFCEIFISFSRRVINKRSPFKGDHHHVHHILKDKYEISPNHVGTMFLIVDLVAVFSGIYSTKKFGPVFGFIITNLLILSFMFFIGFKTWFNKKNKFVSVKDLYDILKKKDVDVLSSDIFDDLEIKVLKKASSSEHDKKDRAA